MDHKNSENGSDIIPDLQSNPDETSVKTIHQQNLEKGNRTRVSKTIAYTLLGALSVVLIIVVFVLPSFVDKAPEKVSVIEAETPATKAINLSVLAQKPIAQAMFSELLIKIDELKLYGIQFWGGDQWSQAVLLQQDGDDDYQSAKYDLAANKYRKAMQILVDLEISVPARLQEALKKGQNAILSGNKDQAVSNFEIALAIDGTNQEAKRGLDRALKLDRVLELTTLGLNYETEREWQNAMQSFTNALVIDSEWVDALDGLARSTEAFEAEQYKGLLSAGYQLIKESKFDEARSAFEQASTLQPDSVQVAQAFEELGLQERMAKIKALKYEALSAEVNERWASAQDLYESILELDPNISEIQENLIRVNQRITLENNLIYFSNITDKLNDDKLYNQAVQLLGTADSIVNKGPSLEKQIADLRQILSIAATPVPVTIFSDEMTEVVIYKIGNLGVFKQNIVTLRPGVYIATGSRTGYRDLQIRFKVSGNTTNQTIRVECKERI